MKPQTRSNEQQRSPAGGTEEKRANKKRVGVAGFEPTNPFHPKEVRYQAALYADDLSGEAKIKNSVC